MKSIKIMAFDLAQKFVGVSEIAGSASDPQTLTTLRLDAKWPQDDQVRWCSAFMNYIAASTPTPVEIFAGPIRARHKPANKPRAGRRGIRRGDLEARRWSSNRVQAC